MSFMHVHDSRNGETCRAAMRDERHAHDKRRRETRECNAGSVYVYSTLKYTAVYCLLSVYVCAPYPYIYIYYSCNLYKTNGSPHT